VGVFTVWGGGAVADAEVLAVTGGPTMVSAFGGVAAWSERDPASGMYRLIAAQAGRQPEPLPIAPRAVPFDVDVGPGANREPVLVYSRCRDEPGYGALAGLTFVPAWARARGCDVYGYDLRRQKEAKLPGASDRRVSEYLPSRWRNRLVFAVIDPQRPGMRALQPRLATIDLRRPAVVRYVPTGRHGFYPPGSSVRGNRTDGGPGVVAVDLYGTRVAFSWQLIGARCSLTNGEDRNVADPATTEIWLASLRGRARSRRISRACEWEKTAILQSPGLAGGRLSFIAGGPGIAPDLPRRLITRPLDRSASTRTPLPPCTISASRDGDVLYISRRSTCPQPTPLQADAYEVIRQPLTRPSPS